MWQLMCAQSQTACFSDGNEALPPLSAVIFSASCLGLYVCVIKAGDSRQICSGHCAE